MIIIIILSILLVAEGANVPTDCNQQLHNYYVAKGMPVLTPVQQAITLTPGVLLGVSYVTIEMALQETAMYYANLLPNTTLANESYVVYVTLDIPWCISELLFECCDNVSTGTAKTQNCTTISDFDLGGSDPVAGRFFIYSNQTFPCEGTPKVTFFNTSIFPANNGTYTYDVVGIRDHIQMNYTTSRTVYRSSKCEFSDGDPLDIVDQNQFVCVMPQVGCNATRVGGQPSLDIIPLPQFRCIGQLSPNASTSVLIDVVNLQPPTGIEGEFKIGFVSNLALAAGAQAQLSLLNNFKISLPNTRRQFDSGFDSFDFYILLNYNDRWTNYQPVYEYSNDPILQRVPCICDFSMDCLSPGVADLNSYATFQLSLSNSPPRCDPGPAFSVPLGTTNITLNATLSFDPDGSPGLLYYYWGVYSTPYSPSPPPFNITDPTAVVTTIYCPNCTSGLYIFYLYVSDQQAIPVCTWNLTIRENELVAIISPSEFTEYFDFYSGNEANHSCLDYPPSPSISLNGTLSYATLVNTVISYIWVQTSGPPLLYSCDDVGFFTTRAFFDTNESVAHFVPSSVGYYCFQLLVTDGTVNSTVAQACVTVNPNFGQPPSTMTPIINYTDPPLRNLTPPTRPNITFPPTTDAPFEPFEPVSQQPTAEVIVPPLIPIQPNITNLEVLSFFGLFIGSLLILLFLWLVWLALGDRRYSGPFQRKILSPSTSG